MGGPRRQRKMRPRQRESRVRGAGAAEVCSVGSFLTWTQGILILIGPIPGLCIEDVCPDLLELTLMRCKQGTIVGMTMMALADRKGAKTGEWVV